MSTRSWLAVVVICMAAGAGVAWLNQNVAAVESTPQVATQPLSEDQGEGTLVKTLDPVEGTIPEFSLTGLDGEVWDADKLKGKPWVINFWATWCPPCIEEIPSMNAAYEVLEPQGIGMLAINAGEGGEAVELFLEKIGIDFPNVLGDADTLPNWSVIGLPTTFVVDAEGNLVLQAQGPRAWDDEELLKQVADAAL